jgi:hypothetical protein
MTLESKRKDARSSLFLSAVITVADTAAPVTVRVRNLSEGGMMVDSNPKFVHDVRISAGLEQSPDESPGSKPVVLALRLTKPSIRNWRAPVRHCPPNTKS